MEDNYTLMAALTCHIAHAPGVVADMIELIIAAIELCQGMCARPYAGRLVGQRQENACPVAYVPLPYAPSPRSHSSRPKFGGGQTWRATYRIIIFGYLNVNRRLDSLLQALNTLPDGDLFRLDIYGRSGIVSTFALRFKRSASRES